MASMALGSDPAGLITSLALGQFGFRHTGKRRSSSLVEVEFIVDFQVSFHDVLVTSFLLGDCSQSGVTSRVVSGPSAPLSITTLLGLGIRLMWPESG